MVKVAIGAALLVALTACGGPPEPDYREVLQSHCMSKGGAYFEYESTSAGAHIWCVKPDGAAISLDGGE